MNYTPTEKWLELKQNSYAEDPTQTLEDMLRAYVAACKQYLLSPDSHATTGLLKAATEHIELFLNSIQSQDEAELIVKADAEISERIICAANYYDDGKEYSHAPRNIRDHKTGFVTSGRRHHNCIATFSQIAQFHYDEFWKKVKLTEVQGFLTDTDRFVTRQEAYAIAFAANQIIGPNKGCPTNYIGLTSEDLY